MQWLVKHLIEVKWHQGLSAILKSSQANPSTFQTTESLFLSQTAENQLGFVRDIIALSKENATGDLHKALVEILAVRPFVLHASYVYLTTENAIQPADLQTFLTKHQGEILHEGSFLAFSDGGVHWQTLRDALSKHEYAKEILDKFEELSQSESFNKRLETAFRSADRESFEKLLT